MLNRKNDKTVMRWEGGAEDGSEKKYAGGRGARGARALESEVSCRVVERDQRVPRLISDGLRAHGCPVGAERREWERGGGVREETGCWCVHDVESWNEGLE